MQFLPGIMKGKNAYQRGAYFKNHMRRFKYILKTDFERFDATQGVNLLYCIEVGLAARLLSPEEFQLFFPTWLIKIRKMGKYPSGLMFHFVGCRGSGDMDTGLFNTLINYISQLYFLRCNGLDGTPMADGDDGGLNIDTLDFVDTFKEFGLCIDIEPVTDYHDFRFCSSAFVEYNRAGDMVQVQDVHKLLNNIGIVKSKKFYHCVGEYYYSLGFMYSKVYAGFPLFTELADMLMRISERKFIHRELLETLNPTFSVNLDTVAPEVDSDYLKTELMMAFGLGGATFDGLCETLRNMKVQLPRHMDKRYRVSSDKTNRLSSEQLRAVEQMLLDSVRRAAVPTKLQLFTYLTPVSLYPG
jgi:hypothetical protein